MLEQVLAELLAYLSVEYFLYVTAVCFGCAVFVAVAPTKLTQKIPDFLMVIINFCALNFWNSVNKKTNIKGNPLDENPIKDARKNS